VEQTVFGGWTPFLRSTRPRPKREDKEIKHQVAIELCRRLVKRVSDLSLENFEEMCEDVEEATSFETSGYKIARELESLGWDVDDEIVDVVREAPYLQTELWRAAVKKWVIDAQAEASFEVGETVKFLHHGKEVEGQIVKIERETGEYVVRCSTLGHVEGGTGVRGSIVAYEECRLA